MPVYLDVQPRLDDRAARQVSDQATKHFADAGKTVGQQFSEGISAGLASSDAAVRKSAENTEKAYKRAADAAGMTRVEEAKLEDLRIKGTGATAMLVQSEKLEKAKRAEVSTTRTAITALQDLDVAHASAANSGSLLSGVLQGIAQGATGTRIGGIASAIEGIGTKGIIAAVGVTAIGTAIVAGTKALYDLGAAWDDISDNITGRTGIMGDQLHSIVDTVRLVGNQSAVSLKDISQLGAGVAQSLHLGGDAATAMTQKLADIQQVTSQAVNTKDLGKAFRLFDITDVQTEIDTLGQLTAASQSADIPINTLLTTLGATGRASKEAGLNLQQTLGLMLTLQDAGVGFDRAGTALTLALKNWAKEGRDANQALAETITKIKALIDAGNESAAQTLATQTFGRTGWIEMFDAIKSGTLDVNGLTDGLKKLGDTKSLIEDQKKSTEDWHESWKKLTNQLQSDLGPVAEKVFNGINSVLEFSSRNLHQATNDVKDLATSINSINPDKLATAMGLPGMPGAPAAPAGPGLPTTAPGAPTTGLGPNFYHDWYKTPDELKREQKQSGAPVLPYDTSLPQGFGNVPQTSGIVSAENSYMDARHTLAEKQARVTQLEHDTTAKAEDITKARNDVVNAQQSQQQAELQLYDARTSLYNKENKALNAHTAALGEFGAALDKDLGISKGLSGIADNLVRFLGNLIAAPFLSQMNALSNAPGQAQGGFGIIGQLGAQGAFGPQYTAAGQAAAAGSGSASAIGPAVLQPGGGVSYGAPTGGGEPYGLPRGSNSGGYGGGGTQFPDWVNQLGAAFGVKPSTYPGHQETDRHEAGFAPNPQDLNRAIDWSGPVDNMQRFSEYLSTVPGSLEQLIFKNPQTGQQFGIAGGQDVSQTGYYAGDYGGHEDHVHTRQSVSIPLPGGGGGGGGGQSPLPVSVQQWHADWPAIAQGESGGNWATNTGNGYSGGLQFSPSSWQQAGGTQYAPNAYQASPYQQAMTGENLLAQQGPGAWPNTFVPGSAGPAAPGTWGGPGIPAGITGGGGQSPIWGANPAGPGLGGSATAGIPGGPMAGAGAGSQIGAAVGPPKGTGSGGVGMTEGGLLDTAIGLGAAAFPGVGQAAQTGIKLANRAIKFAGQAAAIGVQGIQQTFLPTGGSELANNSWFSKVLGGIAGAAPALPNMAGKPAAPPAQGQQGQQGGDTHNTTNINVDAQSRDTGQGIANDVAYHQGASQLPPGKP